LGGEEPEATEGEELEAREGEELEARETTDLYNGASRVGSGD
jgi:hypothetical protein